MPIKDKSGEKTGLSSESALRLVQISHQEKGEEARQEERESQTSVQI